MNNIIYVLWALIGIGLSLLMFKTQHWSVKAISAEKPNKSMLIVIGGAIMRWGLFSLSLAFALSYSILAMLALFLAFILTRTMLLVTWNRMLTLRQEKIIN